MGNRKNEKHAYGNPGSYYVRLGEFKKAIHFYELKIEIIQEMSNRIEEGTLAPAFTFSEISKRPLTIMNSL